MAHGISLLAAFVLATGGARQAEPAAPLADVKVTQKYLVPLCLDGARLQSAERRWKLTLQEHSLAFTMRGAPRQGTQDAAPGVALVRFTPEAGHRYEVEVRAPAASYSLRVWKQGDWAPVVRDRTMERIVSSAPEWTDPACQ